MSMDSFQLLLVEDNPADVVLFKTVLMESEAAHIFMRAAESLQAATEILAAESIDIVMLDLSLPDSQGVDTVSRLREQAPEVPVVVLTGLLDEALGLETVRRGAQDYLVKGQLNGALLARAVRYAIERSRADRERDMLIKDLQNSLAQVRRLSGLLPICACCKKIKNDDGYWAEVEQYFRENSDAEFSHGYCPDCAEKLRAEALSYFEKHQGSESD